MAQAQAKGNGQTLPTREDFVLKALAWNKTRPDAKGKGMHVNASGLRTAFARVYAGANITDTLRAMEAAGSIVSRPAKGGFVIYLPGDKPESMARPEHLLAGLGITV